MIHACLERKWYVEEYLVPSLLMEGIEFNQIIVWIDNEKIGNLESCMKAFDSLPQDDGQTWHLQDDVIICNGFKERTEATASYAPIVCAYCYPIASEGLPSGPVPSALMWYSFPCIKIENRIAKQCAEWYYTIAKDDKRYRKLVSEGKYDDSMFREFCKEHYGEEVCGYNLTPNLVDHIDFLIGGSLVNKDRYYKRTQAASFKNPEKIQELEDKLEKKEMRVAAYCATRNLYKDMLPAAKSLLVNSNVDKIYFLIEDDEFPQPLPPEIEVINVSSQAFFRKNGPNMNSRFTYMAMMRAALPFYFPQYRKILSLDIDTIVDQDVSDLWDIDLSGYYLAACIEPDRCAGGKYHKNSCKLYFNAGVVMYNLDEYRGRKVLEVIKSLNEKEYPFLEQDCLCELCDGCILPISNDYNCTNYSDYAICGKSYNPKIYHYAAIKDWQNYPEVKKYREMKITDGEKVYE